MSTFPPPVDNARLDSAIGGPLGNDAAVLGQQHDRILFEKQSAAEMAKAPNPDTDITVTQRMLSATLGSVLTSLLGKSSKDRAHSSPGLISAP